MSCRYPPKHNKCSRTRQKYHTRSGRLCCRKSRSSSKKRTKRSQRSSKPADICHQPFLIPSNGPCVQPHQNYEYFARELLQPRKHQSCSRQVALAPQVQSRSPHVALAPQVQPRSPQVALEPHSPQMEIDQLHSIESNLKIRGQQLPKGLDVFDRMAMERDIEPANPFGVGQVEVNRPQSGMNDFSGQFESLAPRTLLQPSLPTIAPVAIGSGPLLINSDLNPSGQINFEPAPSGQSERIPNNVAARLLIGQGQELQPRIAPTVALAGVASAMVMESPVTKQDIVDAKEHVSAVVADAKAEIKQLDVAASEVNKEMDDEHKARQLSTLYYARLAPFISGETEKWIPNILKVMSANNIEQSQKFEKIITNPKTWLYYLDHETVGWYSANGYMSANTWLIQSILGTLPSVKDIDIFDLIVIARILLLRELVISNTYDIDLNVWRWSNQEKNNMYNPKEKENRDKNYNNLNLYNTVGSMTNVAPFQSTSLSKKSVYEYAMTVNRRFDKNQRLIINPMTGQVSICCIEKIIIPKGTQCLYTGGLNNSEFEVLLPPCTQFVVTKSRTDKGSNNIVSLKPKAKQHKHLSNETIAWIILYIFNVNHQIPFGNKAASQTRARELIETKMRDIYANEFVGLCNA